MEKIAIITDTWEPDFNGIVTDLTYTKKFLEQKNFSVRIIHREEFMNIPTPIDPQINFAILTSKHIEDIIKVEKPDYIHIATEGPVGVAGRNACVKNNWPFTTFYHTQMPEYLQIRIMLYHGITYNYLRWFHKPSRAVMVGTDSMKQVLEKARFKNIVTVPYGVDADLFKRNTDAKIPEGIHKPVFVYVGRIAPEKNIQAFLNCSLPGTKLIIGEGPAKKNLEKKYGDKAVFVGYKKGQELVDLLSISDVFVFPSKTDTFGLAMLEALACGLPVAAFVAQGAADIVSDGIDGYLGDDLEANAIKCLELDRDNCRKKALEFSWSHSVDVFLSYLVHL